MPHMRLCSAVVVFVGGMSIGVGAWVAANRWPDGAVPMHVNLGSSPALADGCPDWACVASSAFALWNTHLDRLGFVWTNGPSVTADRRDRVNAVVFGDRAQGEAFGSRTLAVTISYSNPFESRLVEADVVFNTAYAWNSYRGSLRPGVRDFRRVAIHEFGHVLGFQHPDQHGQRVSSVMNSTDGNIDTLTLEDVKGAFGIYGSGTSGTAVPFPPRNETRDFRFALETTYRHTLNRPSLESFVDVEGAVVWTQEYLRYRLNGCSDTQARGRVRWQILSAVGGDASVAPVCGSVEAFPPFPPRNETFGFRQDLERLYRDELRRGTVRTVVDIEGDVVWIQEYLRYRLGGCSDGLASAAVLRQIAGGGVLDCR